MLADAYTLQNHCMILLSKFSIRIHYMVKRHAGLGMCELRSRSASVVDGAAAAPVNSALVDALPFELTLA